MTVVGPETRTGITDINGQVTFYDLQAGSYLVTIVASGFIAPPPYTASLVHDVVLTFDLQPQVVKANAASVWTTNNLGDPKSQFNQGETVYIYWNPAPPGSVVDIKVVDSSDVVVAGPWLAQPVGNAPLSFVPPGPGMYRVLVNGQPAWTIAVATLFVVPESILGTLMATFAGFAAFVTIGVVKSKNKKTNSKK